jgi:hypothetical protein
VLECDRAPPYPSDQLTVVCRHDDRRATRVDFPEQVHDLEREVRIEIARGLVGQHQHRIVDERTGDGYPLLLAARELSGVRVHPVLEPDPFEHLKGLASLLHVRRTQHLRHERRVLQNGLPRNELEVLKHEPDASPVRLNLTTPQDGQITARHLKPPFRGQILTQQQAQKGRFAGPARTGQKDELTFVNGKEQVP